MYADKHFLGVAALIFCNRSLLPPMALNAFISHSYRFLSENEVKLTFVGDLFEWLFLLGGHAGPLFTKDAHDLSGLKVVRV